MSAKFSFGTMRFDFNLGQAAAKRAPREAEDAFNLAIVGNFSGHSNKGATKPAGPGGVRRVDADNYEKVMAGLGAELKLNAPGEEVRVAIQSIEDFHPDCLLKKIPSLAKLIEKRKQLLNPATAGTAEAEIRQLLSVQPVSSTGAANPGPARVEADADTLGRLLGVNAPATPAGSPGAGSSQASTIDKLIKSMVASSSVPSASPQQSALLSTLDLHLAETLRTILHQSDFQTLEAAWRGLDMVVREFGGEENLKVTLVDISHHEMAKDLSGADNLENSAWAKLLAQQPDERRFTLCLGQFVFGDTLAEVETVGRLAKIAAAANTPFIAGASPKFAGCDSFEKHPYPENWNHKLDPAAAEAWEALGKLPEAHYVGLALPRFLLRQPYGKGSDPIESFPFEEMGTVLVHEDFLWGNPSILCGVMIGRAFVSEGWEFEPAGYAEVGELPVYKFYKDGESEVKPCAETWLSERAAEAITARHLIPILSVKGRDSVRVAAWQSLAGKPLSIV